MRKGYNDNTSPIADTSYNVHETIIGMLDKGKGRALDAGAGFGLLSKKMAELGYDVTACELDPVRIRHVRTLGIRCDKVDLNDKLPYKSGAFDIVVSSDVVEHLRNPFSAIIEMGRVTKKGGLVIISTPNTMNWYSRIKFLFSGVYNNYFTEKEFEGRGYHISPLHYYQLRWMMEQAGLEIVEIRANQYSGVLNFSSLKIAASSILSLPARLFMKPRIRPLLEGDIIIVKAKKVK